MAPLSEKHHAGLPESTVDKERIREQIECVANSAVLRNGPVLQRLLRYLGSAALDGGEGDLKEPLIGVEVFGREYGYDPKIDTIVRVQAHRLRVKLKQYYASEGAKDDIVIDIPRGGYAPIFQSRAELSNEPVQRTNQVGDQAASELGEKESFADQVQKASAGADGGLSAQTSLPVEPAVMARGSIFRRQPLVLLAMCLIGVAIGISVGLLMNRNGRTEAGNDLPKDVRSFWSSFLEGDTSPVLVYPDATFLLDQTNDLFRFRQGAVDQRGTLVDPHLAKSFASNPEEVERAGPLYYENGYTGAGELESVALIAPLVAQLGANLIVKPSSELTPDDLMHHSVILLGSSFQNSAVREHANRGDFQFISPEGNIEAWQGRILNSNVRAGEKPSYQTERDATGTLLSDTAVVSVLPSIDGRHRLMLLAGLDTAGTKGAVMFVTSSRGIQDLIRSGVAPLTKNGEFGRPLSTFQALIKVELQNGKEALSSQMLTAHAWKGKP